MTTRLLLGLGEVSRNAFVPNACSCPGIECLVQLYWRYFESYEKAMGLSVDVCLVSNEMCLCKVLRCGSLRVQWPEKDILLHEHAHNIQLVGLQ